MFWRNGVLAFVPGIVPCTINSEIPGTMAIGTFAQPAYWRIPNKKAEHRRAQPNISSRYPACQPPQRYGSWSRSRM